MADSMMMALLHASSAFMSGTAMHTSTRLACGAMLPLNCYAYYKG